MQLLAPNSLIHQRYLISRRIGQGGMGAVYEALDQRLGNTVALKQMLVSGEHLDKAFAREARLLARLRHLALPRVIDYFIEEAGQFLVMDYIPGSDLQNLLEQRSKIPVPEVLLWADQILDALEYLHRQNPPVVHRDIKPQNLKLSPDNEVMLLDFGLAKGYSGGNTQTASPASLHGFTLKYAPIEQIQGTGTATVSDLYSLGATLYHLLTGLPPIDALTRTCNHLNQEPDSLTPIQMMNPQVPNKVSQIVLKAMSLRMQERPASATEMRTEIQTIKTESLTFPLPVLRRAQMASAVLRGAKILWVDDRPLNNINICETLRSFGCEIEQVESSDEAAVRIQKLRHKNEKYDVILSDIARGNSPQEGLLFLNRLEAAGDHPPVIFFTARVERKLLPPGAFAITNLGVELLHYVLDVLERNRI